MNVVNKEYLRNARESKGYSHRDMAKFLKAKSSATYYNIESGKTEPKASQLLIISEVLKIPIKKILQ
ncbi:MAG: helix-turn-helix transcriptional regulator [Clostridia bacterium]|nr:helix-turn-helix transcriptional regulator [Clostridia bacterium]